MTPAIPPLSGKQFTIRAGRHEATITEVGAGLRSYTADGADVTCRYGTDELPPKGCGLTLVPWPNRIRGARYTFDGTAQQLPVTEPDTGNAIHGLGRWERWARARSSDDAITLRLDIVPQKGYPFQVRAEVTYALHPEQGLMVTLGARNVGAGRAPFGAGSHPYLSARGHALDAVTVQLPAREILVLDEAQVPVGQRPVAKSEHDLRRGRRLRGLRMDDAFTGLVRDDTGRGHATVRTRAGGATLWFDASFEFLQVFTKADVTPGQNGVAIEPMTCAPDAFNSGAGLMVLEPGAAWTGSWGIVPIR